MGYLTHSSYSGNGVGSVYVIYICRLYNGILYLMMTANATHIDPKRNETADAMPWRQITLLRRLIFYFVRRFFINSMNVLHTNIVMVQYMQII